MSLKHEILRGTILLVLVVSAAGWFVVRRVKFARDPGAMASKLLITALMLALIAYSIWFLGPLGPFVIVACAIPLSLMWTPHLGAALAKPLTGLYDGGDEVAELRPFYSIAQAKQKRGLYAEAIMEIEKQLGRFPTDVEGQMLMARIQAENLDDMDAADATIQRLAAQPGHPPGSMVGALYTLADWRLKFSKDPEAARAALERIVQLFPETEYARDAAQRSAHLTTDPSMLSEHKAFAVPQGVRSMGLLKVPIHFQPKESDPEQQAQAYIDHLEQHPLDAEAREKLAQLYVESFSRLDLASDQLEQMIANPNHPARLIVRWLNMLADCQVRCGANYETVRATLQRIVDMNPNFAAAEQARNRMAVLKLELKGQEKGQAVKLGVYEQNVGLRAARRRSGEEVE